MSAIRELLHGKLSAALPAAALASIDAASAAIRDDPSPRRLAESIALASRHVRLRAWTWSPDEIASAWDLLEGWNPERSTPLETARAVLVLARGDLAEESGARALEEAFRDADVGELCALYKTIALLPGPERFVARAAEGCRTSMRAVFEAVACDSPFPARRFDDVAWRQMVIKCLFVEAPLARVHGLDRRLDPELARMALDLADERRSAGRAVNHELWMCLGRHGGERGVDALEREIAGAHAPGRRAAAIALARAGEVRRLAELAAAERDPAVLDTMRLALGGWVDQRAFAAIAAPS